MPKLMSLDQAVAQAIQDHPILYASSSYKTSRLLVLDQIFNTNGNGWQDFESFLNQFKAKKDLPSMPPEHLVNGTVTYDGYAEFKMIGTYKMPVFESKKVIGIIEEQKEQYPEIVVWQDNRLNDEPRAPYPNFSKKYSTFYNIGEQATTLFDASWFNGMIEFYEHCRDFFLQDDALYHVAYPKSNEKQNERTRQDYLKAFERYRKKDMEEKDFQKVISKEYQFPYHGDLEEFLVGKWQKERHRILAFIDNVIEDANLGLSQLESKASSNPKRFLKRMK